MRELPRRAEPIVHVFRYAYFEVSVPFFKCSIISPKGETAGDYDIFRAFKQLIENACITFFRSDFQAFNVGHFLPPFSFLFACISCCLSFFFRHNNLFFFFGYHSVRRKFRSIGGRYLKLFSRIVPHTTVINRIFRCEVNHQAVTLRVTTSFILS
nr:MAG TPA: hypothetical protein [Caudoviricetes sp.]